MHILIVEDNPVMMTILKTNLEKHKFEVSKAYNGKHALGILKNSKNPIDIIISDIIMPEMTGFELIEFLNKQQEWSKIPVILCSSLHEIDHITKAKQLGCRHYIVKPIKMASLFSKIQDIMIQDSSVELDSITSHNDKHDEQITKEIAVSFARLVAQKIDFLESQKLDEMTFEMTQKFSDLKEAAGNFGAKWIQKVLSRLEEAYQEQNGQLDADQRMKLLRELKKLHSILPKTDFEDEKITTTEQIDEFRSCIEKFNPDVLAKFEKMIKHLGYVKPKTSYVKSVSNGMLAYDDVYASQGKLLIGKGQEVSDRMMSQLVRYSENSNVIEPFRMVSLNLDDKAPLQDAKKTKRNGAPPIILQEAMEIVDGDKDLYQELFQEFLQMLPNQLSQINLFFNQKNFVELGKEAHSLKGASSNLCAGDIARNTRDIENAAKDNDANALSQLLPQLLKNVENATEYYLNIDWDKV